MFRCITAAVLLTAALAGQTPQTPPPNPFPPLFKGGPLKDNDPNARTVEGVVKDEGDNPLDGAVVKLKDTKTLEVRSFITKADGKYRFTGLRKDVDYELKADFKGRATSAKTVSVFDSRRLVVLNLKLADKEEGASKDGDRP